MNTAHRSEPEASPWDEFMRRAREYLGTGVLHKEELEYKRQMGRDLESARNAVLAGDHDWQNLLRRALRARSGHPVAWRLVSDLNHWCSKYEASASGALRSLWRESDASAGDRMRAFVSLLPNSALRGGAGSRTNVASVLLMGLDVESYPPFRVTAFERAYELTRYRRPEPGADEGAIYEHALGFLDRLIEEANRHGLQLKNRLEAQSVVWQVARHG